MKQDSNKVSSAKEFKFIDILRMLLSKLLWVALSGVVLAIIVGIFTMCFVQPKYEAYTTMVVNHNRENISGSVSQSDVQAANELANTFNEILKSYSVVSSVIEKTELNHPEYEGKLSVEKVKAMVDIGKVYEAQMIKVSVTSTDPQLSKAVARSYADVAAKEIEKHSNAGSVSPLDQAILIASPVSPNTFMNCIIAFIIGFFVSACVIVFITVHDTTLYDTDDLDRITDLPVLGIVPEINVDENTNTELWLAVERGSISFEQAD